MSAQKETRFPSLQKPESYFSDGGQFDRRTPRHQRNGNRSSHLFKRQSQGMNISGYLSTWPAHVTSQIVCQERRNASTETPRVQGCYEVSDRVAKPRFLDLLERYLRRELLSVNTQQPKVQERRLQVYREVFDFFIEEFKTYKLLLSAIKNEYEITLAYLHDQITELKPLRAQLAIVSEQCERRVLALQEEERSEVRALKLESQHLHKIIDSMREKQESLQTQVHVLEKDLAEQYLAYRQEYDARKLLIASIANVSYRPEEKAAEEEEKARDDPVMIKLALRACREDLTKAQVELNCLQADYGDVVPRKDWEALQRTQQESLHRLQILQTDFDQVKAEYDTLLDVHKQVVLQRDSFQGELKALRGTSTPRPHWQDCADLLGGSERWAELSAGKSSQQLLRILVEKLEGRSSDSEDFTGLGTEENVPVYLRYEGKFKNLKLTLSELVGTIKEVWKEKAIVDEQSEKSELPEFLHRHLQNQHGDQAGAWAYSLVEACRQHEEDQLVSLFNCILTGKVDESVYHGQIQLRSHLLKELIRMDATESGSLTVEEIRQALERVFPLKAESEIEELVTAAQSGMDNSVNSISYHTLYSENADGGYSHFLSLLMKQALSEKASTSDI